MAMHHLWSDLGVANEAFGRYRSGRRIFCHVENGYATSLLTGRAAASTIGGMRTRHAPARARTVHRPSSLDASRRTVLRLIAVGATAPFSSAAAFRRQEVPLESIPIASARLADVNTTDLHGAIALACETMGRVFNRDDSDIPFFAATVLPEARMAFNPSHSESHVPGRHLNALLTAEAVLDVEVPETVIERHAQAAYFSYSGGVALPLNRERIDGPLTRFLPHNLREGFHALYALARYRSSVQARELATDSIAAIRQYWTYDNGWDASALGRDHRLQVIEWEGPFITGIARALGPLVKYHRATGFGPALDLANDLTAALLQDYFTEAGTFDRETFGTHTHSTTCVMSSLAQYADHCDDDAVMALSLIHI